jgi:hypothetical protein
MIARRPDWTRREVLRALGASSLAAAPGAIKQLTWAQLLKEGMPHARRS